MQHSKDRLPRLVNEKVRRRRSAETAQSKSHDTDDDDSNDANASRWGDDSQKTYDQAVEEKNISRPNQRELQLKSDSRSSLQRTLGTREAISQGDAAYDTKPAHGVRQKRNRQR